MEALYETIILCADSGTQLILTHCGDGYLAAAGEDLENLDKAALCAYLEALETLQDYLDANEPGEGEALEAWEEAHEALEDHIDEVSELLDEMA